MWICTTFLLKSMRLTVKVVWTFKNGVEGAVLISSIFVIVIFFAVLLSTGTKYTQNKCPHLKNIYRIMKRGYHLLESIFDPKTQLKTIVPLGMEVQLLQTRL